MERGLKTAPRHVRNFREKEGRNQRGTGRRTAGVRKRKKGVRNLRGFLDLQVASEREGKS